MSECERLGALQATLEAHVRNDDAWKSDHERTNREYRLEQAEALRSIGSRLAEGSKVLTQLEMMQVEFRELARVVESMEKQQARVEGATGLARWIGGVVLALFGSAFAAWVVGNFNGGK